MNLMCHSIYLQILIFLRIKQAVFFTLIFPVFLFIIFASLWGNESDEYIFFLLTGIIGMTIASDGLFAIGPVIKEYYANGLVKYLKKLPFNILIHFLGLIISRIISLIFSTILLCISAFLIFDYLIEIEELFNFSIGIATGLCLFSFLGLVISMLHVKQKDRTNKGLINFLYFAVLFTSDAFYPVGEFNPFIGSIGNYLPLNPILNILRGNGISYLTFVWIVMIVLLFVYFFKTMKFDR